MEFYGFIDLEKAAELGKSVEEVESPYQVWNNPGLGFVFYRSRDKVEREKILNCSEFKRLESDTRYVLRDLRCGN